MLTSKEIKDIFIKFFECNGHVYKKPSLLVQENDPSLMFTNAGMNQFKDIFVGKKEIDGKRFVNSQMCLRISGKHNDLDEVGVDNYHHTLFEMLGNWSMNDYFKKEAIDFAWKLLTEEYKIDKNRLYVTVFEGDDKDRICRDDETYEIWKKYVNEDCIVFGNKKDNFWEMGEYGPCGPCSEIHIDLRDNEKRKIIPGKSLVNSGNPDVIEIWNIVFIQYERIFGEGLKFLEKHFIDTGIGFERLVRVLQCKKSSYETDIFIDYIGRIEKFSEKKYGSDEKVDIAMRVIADHIRAIVLTIGEGLIPSNVKQGYVIRRILRRAVMYGYSFLGLVDPFLYKFVDIVLEKFKFADENIVKNKNEIENVIYCEEESFFRTLKIGLKRLEDFLNKNSNNVIDGKFVFELKDTYGFPVDLTDIILKARGFTYNKVEYEKCLEEQRNRSRVDLKSSEKEWIVVKDGEQEFVGYDKNKCRASILRYRKNSNEVYEIVFNKTPFYGESGGQIGDSGFIKLIDGNKIRVLDTKKVNGENVHFIEKLPDRIDGEFEIEIDTEKREKVSRYHSVTHLLHSCLKKKFGNNVRQMGSKVEENKLRFDFNFDRNLAEDEIKNLEKDVNDKIEKGFELVERMDVKKEEAFNEGVIGLFTDKYGEKVRIIAFGDFSKELCCGTHVRNTKEIGVFKILKCKGISSGIKRIEAILI